MAARKNQIPKLIRQIESVAQQVIQKVAFDITGTLRKAPGEGGTPVDTGWARGNWLVNIGTPVITPSGSPDAVPPAAATDGAIALYKLSQGKLYISNNVPYISKLNDGYSKQAPPGFVQAAILRAVSGLATVKVVPA